MCKKFLLLKRLPWTYFSDGYEHLRNKIAGRKALGGTVIEIKIDPPVFSVKPLFND
jgi:hypothetical protein